MNTKYKNVAEANKALRNKKVKVTSPVPGINSGHGYSVGTILTISNCSGSLTAPYFGYFHVLCPNTGMIRGIYGAEFSIMEYMIEALDLENIELEKKIKDLKDEMRKNSQKIKFMKENNLKEFDETDFKVFSVLETLETEGLSKVERAKVIAKLIKE